VTFSLSWFQADARNNGNYLVDKTGEIERFKSGSVISAINLQLMDQFGAQTARNQRVTNSNGMVDPIALPVWV
jgi:hypothetical protein